MCLKKVNADVIIGINSVKRLFSIVTAYMCYYYLFFEQITLLPNSHNPSQHFIQCKKVF